jgi:hypothetical protein
MLEFSSLNPYQSIEQITGESPDELVKLLKQIRTPIKIIAITSYGSRQVAYVAGDVRKSQQIRAEKPLKIKGA